jgi:hypothetical protein
MICNRCNGTGFLNIHQILDDAIRYGGVEAIQNWMKENTDNDVCICDCCGDGDGWYGEPGRHYGTYDPSGKNGPYAYNGGLCECH